MNKNISIVLMALMLCVSLCIGCLDQPEEIYVEEEIEEEIDTRGIIIGERIKTVIDSKTSYDRPVFDSYHYRNGEYVYGFYRIVNGDRDPISISAHSFSFLVNGMKCSSVYTSIGTRDIAPGEELRFRIYYSLPGIDETTGDSIYTPSGDKPQIHHDESVLNEANRIRYDFEYTTTKNLTGNEASFGYVWACVNYTIINTGIYPIDINPGDWLFKTGGAIVNPDEISYQPEWDGVDIKTLSSNEIYHGKLVFEISNKDRGFSYLSYPLSGTDACMIWSDLSSWDITSYQLHRASHQPPHRLIQQGE